MKSLQILSFSLTLSMVVSASIWAQPSSKGVPSHRRVLISETSQQPEIRPQTPAGDLACATMLAPKRGGTKNVYRAVTCTPKMLQNDPRCQRACGKS